MCGGQVGVSEECLDPSPNPLPLDPGTDRSATHWSAQDGTRWLREGLREPKMAFKMAQDNARSLKLASKMLQETPPAPRRFQGPPGPAKAEIL
eukprot:6327920-Pyramimonas_sp.AAC.1